MYIRLNVIAGAKKEKLKCRGSGKYDISVKEPAELNRANKRALSVLSKELGVPIKNLRILIGHHLSRKLVSVRKVDTS
ncbi:MAG: DUF167 domain-containing protein [Patescibacteria group bacterium]|nr:DUF167 domain-containing protein [Patescibacteria group bacterium]